LEAIRGSLRGDFAPSLFNFLPLSFEEVGDKGMR